MITPDAPYRLRQLMRRFITLRLTETLCWSVAVTAIVLTVLHFAGTSNSFKILIAIIVFVLSFTIQLMVRRVKQIDLVAIARYLDFNYPGLENSTDLLLLNPASLHGLKQLQYDKTAASLETVAASVRFPHRLGLAAGACLFSLALITISSLWYRPGIEQVGRRTSSIEPDYRSEESLPPGLSSLEISVEAPAYTGVSRKKSFDPNLSVPEDSKVSWQITFDQRVKSSKLIIANSDTIHLDTDGATWLGSRQFGASSIYRIAWRSENDSLMISDYYAIDVITDRPPRIETTNLKQFTELELHQRLDVNVSASLYDDYGLTESYLVATVAKGSGESVKFREEKLRFDLPHTIAGKAVKASRNLDLTQLGLDPGDELYFYVIAFDNRRPQPNYSRTETFFISLIDTAETDAGFDGSLGVDLMPEYFRSQRQIIIDSEKLLKEKPTITKKDFDSRSNELAHDQKILRLRYGQFLGEEFESGIAHEESGVENGNHDHDDEEEESDLTKKFGHVHDGDNEHNLVPEHDHDHDHADTEKEKDEDPIEKFIHRHDDPEEATFFTQSIRAKLKATLSIMWDAELHLRLSDPAKSLPYQYKALRFLKEISNDSRIYVHKTGFDAPPIKEEKRLTGELDEVRGTIDRYAVSDANEHKALSDALKLVEKKVHSEHRQLTEKEKQVLRLAGEKIASLAIASPGQYLETLSILQRITKSADSSPSVVHLKKIGESLGSILPINPERIVSRKSILHRVDSLFVKNFSEK